MATTLSYNGFSGFSSVSIDSWHQEPVFAEDGLSRIGNRYRIRGTALIQAVPSGDSFKTQLDNVRAKLNRSRGDFVLEVGSLQHVNVSGPDIMDGPHGRFTINQIFGSQSAAVAFEIEYADYEVGSGEAVQHVLSHRWNQSFTIGSDGHTVWNVSGSLVVNAKAPATASGALDTGSNPDAWRNTVFPSLPESFRWTDFKFATDDTGNRLIYVLEAREMARNLPAPAFTGNGSFTWRRSIGEGGDAIGIKALEIELQGPVSVTNAQLLDAAFQVAKNRFTFVGPKQDLIMLMEVTESDIFETNRIRLRIMAKATSAAANDGSIGPPNMDLLSDIMLNVDPFDSSFERNPYGSTLVRSVRRTLMTPTSTTIAVSSTETSDAPATTAGTLPGPTFDQAAALVPGGTDAPAQDHIDYPYLSADVTDRVVVADSGVVAMRPNTLSDADVPFQVRRPRVYIVSEGTYQRVGKPPDNPLRIAPAGSIVRSQDWHVTTGHIDMNQNHVFVGRFKRVVEVMQSPSNIQKHWTLTEVGGTGQTGDSTFLQFRPGSLALAMPIDPRILMTTSEDVLEPKHSFYRYPIASDPIVRA